MVESSCLFCKIVAGQIPADKLYESDRVLAFRDIHPQAPFHALVIPKLHIESLNGVEPDHAEILAEMLLVPKRLAAAHGFADAGYRTVINCNHDGGQTVYHLHMHILAGRAMRWPPG